jgi:outer membrane lipoprotein-sorting protein
MKSKILPALALGAALFLPGSASAEAPDPVEIMTKNFFVSKVSGSSQTVTMVLTTGSGETRVRKTTGYTKLQKNGRDNTQVVRFLSPPDVKNVANLLIQHSDRDDDIWIYLPALKKVRKIVASNKKDSFVGSDFSYGDVIGPKVEDWNHKLLKEGTVDGAKVYIIESTPKNEDVRSSSGYSKVNYAIRQDCHATVKADYWDLGGRPFKTITYSDLKEVDPVHHKWLAMKVQAKNLQTQHRTDLVFDSYKLDPGLKDDYFSTRYLEKEQ